MSGTASIANWASIRLSVGSAMFITYFIFACGYWYADLKQEQKPTRFLNMSDLASKLYLFGLGALLTLNYYQSSIYTAIFTYFTMTVIITLILLNLMSSISESTRTKVYLMYYFILFMWYMGIMIDFYITWQNLGNGS